jgi:Ni/Fe-hydrogenase subunit HybB-like protein
MKTLERPAGGAGASPTMRALFALCALATVVLAVRMVNGLGAVTALNDGYPWGLWIAVDVAVGTGLASGGYALALLVYVLNRGRYHPLVRPALVSSFLGYTAAAAAAVFDVGRWWNLWRVPFTPWDWNASSVLLQVAVCELLYVVVLALELAPALVERWRERHPRPGPAPLALARLRAAMPFVIALGLLLPVLHQAGLGSLLLVARTKLHPLWHTPFLPLLFVASSLALGYAVFSLEAIVSRTAFGTGPTTRLLGSLGVVVSGCLIAFVGIRFVGLVAAGRLALTLSSGRMGLLFWAEVLLCAWAAALFLRRGTRANAGLQVRAALLAVAGTSLHRLDVFLVAFDPGAGWRYFPSLGELAITIGLVAGEAIAYAFLVHGVPLPAEAAVRAPEPLRPAAAGVGVGT